MEQPTKTRNTQQQSELAKFFTNPLFLGLSAIAAIALGVSQAGIFGSIVGGLVVGAAITYGVQQYVKLRPEGRQDLDQGVAQVQKALGFSKDKAVEKEVGVEKGHQCHASCGCKGPQEESPYRDSVSLEELEALNARLKSGRPQFEEAEMARQEKQSPEQRLI